MMMMDIRPFFSKFNIIIMLNQQARFYARDPFPSKVTHYLYRARLIDSIRLVLRSNCPNSLPRILNDRLLDSFLVSQALRSAPSVNSALFLVEELEKVQGFSHTKNTLHALATVLAKSHRTAELKSLIDAITAGRFGNVHVSFMNLMQWHAAAGDLESVLEFWDKYRFTANKRACTESYNIVMALSAKKGMDSEAVKIFYRMLDEGANPNCRTYTVMIEHLVNSGKSFAALEVFRLLPSMRIKHTLKQYSVLIESFIYLKRFEEVKSLLNEMQVDGILPSRAMCLSLQQIVEEGFLKDDEFFKKSLSDERIKSIGYSLDSSDDDENEDENSGHACQYEDKKQLKPWLDPQALAAALQYWGPNDLSALEGANFVWTRRLVCKILRNFKSPETAWNFFCWVAYQPGFTHDIYTVQRIVTLLARRGYTELVDRLISKIRVEGMRLPFSTIRLIIDLYGISKNADAAIKVFNVDRELCGPISNFHLMLLYSSLLRALTKCGRDTDVLETLDEMILNGIFPDIQTFSGLMQHFANLGDIKTVQKLFTMVRQSGLEPDAYLYKVLIQGYCKSERSALAWRIFEDMKNSGLMPDCETKELLVKSLWKEGRRREAAAVEESCEEINEVLPLALRGHEWSVSPADLTRVYNIYSESFLLSGCYSVDMCKR